MKLRLVSVGLVLALLISVLINVVQHSLIQSLRLTPTSVASDEPYI